MEEDPDNYDIHCTWTDDEQRRINAPRRPFEITWMRLTAWLQRHDLI